MKRINVTYLDSNQNSVRFPVSLWKKISCLFFIIGCSFCVAKGQMQMESYKVANNAGQPFISKQFLPASPTAASFDVYGKASVNKYTGAPQINIALADASYKELGVSLNLSYQKGNGIKPGEFPGPVGNGWMLSSGGVITRISRGIPPIAFPPTFPILNVNNLTKTPDWSSNAKMLEAINWPKYVTSYTCEFDEFSVSVGGLSGKFYTDYNGVQHFKSTQGEDLAIKMNVESQVRLINLPLEEQDANSPDGSPSISNTYNNGQVPLKQSPYSFEITDSKGVKYTFGGTDESIEFTRPGKSVQNWPDINDGLVGVEPISWYLTSIKSPNGYEINYQYERGKLYLTSHSYVANLFTSFKRDSPPSNPVITGTPTARLISSNLINPTYLKKIITPEATVQFYYSLADQQLGYKFRPSGSFINVDFDSSWHPDNMWCNIYFNGYDNVKNAKNIYNRFPDKLDYFTIASTNGTTKTVSFSYTNDVNTRLKLTSVSIKGSDNDNSTAQVYSFGYNPLALPDYLSFKTDIYGFYNGKNTYITSDDPGYYRPNFANASWRQAYIDSRTPDTVLTQAEILNKVIYPTGGYTEYEYENNKYGRTIQTWPPSLSENPGNTELITGGLRIKKITSYDAINHVASVKSYIYKKAYPKGGTSSSGSLSHQPIFCEEFSGHIDAPHNPVFAYPGNAVYYTGNLYYLNYNTDPLNPMSYNKNSFITYSEISEKDIDGRYTNTIYKNHDNGYLDRPALNAIYDNKNTSNLWKNDDESNMELERGQILSETIYDNTNKIKQQTRYQYNDDTTRFADNGINQRVMKVIPNPIMTPEYGVTLRYIATLAFNYYPYLKEKTTVQFDKTDSVVYNIKYKYNLNRSIIEQSSTDSKGKVLKTVLKYPTDYINITSTDSISAGIKKLNDLHFTASPIETTVYMSESGSSVNQFISSFLTTYKADAPLKSQLFQIKNTNSLSNFIPSKIQLGTFIKDSRYDLIDQIDKYDTKGNIAFHSKPNAPKEVFLWGYGKSYLIAAIKNADYATVQSVLGGATALDLFLTKANPSATEVNTFLAPLRTNALLKGAQVTTYTYTPLTGLISQTDAKGMVSSYDYDNFQRLMNVKDQDGNIIVNHKQNYQYKPPVFSNAEKSGTFTRNNCTGGQTGSLVTYVVPAGAYNSTISQADADNKAIAAIQANGQAYANSNGACTLPNYTVTATSTSTSPWTIVGYLVSKATGDSYLLIAGAASVRTANVPPGQYRLDLTWNSAAEAGKYYLIGLNGNVQTVSTAMGSSTSFDITINGNYSITAEHR